MGCAIEVHKYKSQLRDGRVVEKPMVYKECWEKIRSMKQEMGEGRKDKVD